MIGEDQYRRVRACAVPTSWMRTPISAQSDAVKQMRNALLPAQAERDADQLQRRQQQHHDDQREQDGGETDHGIAYTGAELPQAKSQAARKRQETDAAKRSGPGQRGN